MFAAVVVAPADAAKPQGAPSGATAQCRDGTYSYSAHRWGTCSHHGGVRVWLKRVPAIHHQAAKCPYGCTVRMRGRETSDGSGAVAGPAAVACYRFGAAGGFRCGFSF